jgi:hypothetical protein
MRGGAIQQSARLLFLANVAAQSFLLSLELLSLERRIDPVRRGAALTRR